MQEDDDGHVIALQTTYDLLIKCQDTFLDHFARLGVFCKVQQLIGPDNNLEKDDIQPADPRQVYNLYSLHLFTYLFKLSMILLFVGNFNLNINTQ